LSCHFLINYLTQFALNEIRESQKTKQNLSESNICTITNKIMIMGTIICIEYANSRPTRVESKQNHD